MRAVSLLAVLILPVLASCHGLFMQIPGANGRVGQGLGTVGANISEHSAFYYTPRWLKSRPTACGLHRYKATSVFYEIDWQEELEQQASLGLPTTNGNLVTMRYWQVNEDGAGPFTCWVSPNADAGSWERMEVTQNVPGDSHGKSSQVQQWHTLKAELPSNVTCTGTGGACLIKCQNPNVNPFGGCMAITRGASAKTKRFLGGRGHPRRVVVGNDADDADDEAGDFYDEVEDADDDEDEVLDELELYDEADDRSDLADGGDDYDEMDGEEDEGYGRRRR